VRDHRVAFTKDISKFYQCDEADKAAQHVGVILWRFSNNHKEPEIFMATRVNYGDRPGQYRRQLRDSAKGKKKLLGF
jgi:hypothetical protein